LPSNKNQGGETSKKKSNRPIDTFRPTNLGFCDSSMRMEKKVPFKHIIQQMVGLDGEKTLKNIDGDRNP